MSILGQKFFSKFRKNTRTCSLDSFVCISDAGIKNKQTTLTTKFEQNHTEKDHSFVDDNSSSDREIYSRTESLSEKHSPDVISQVLTSINVISEKTNLSKFQTSDLHATRDWVSKLLSKKLQENKNSRVNYENKLLELLGTEIKSRSIKNEFISQPTTMDRKIEIHGSCSFKPKTGVFEVDIFILASKPSDEIISNKNFSYLWKKNFHLIVHDCKFTETLGGTKNPLPESIMKLKKIWVVVSDKLSSSYTVIEIVIPKTMIAPELKNKVQHYNEYITQKEPECIPEMESKKTFSEILVNPSDIVQPDIVQPDIVQPDIVQSIIDRFRINSSHTSFSTFDIVDLRTTYDYICKILSDKLVKDKKSDISFESKILNSLRAEILSRCNVDAKDSCTEIKSMNDKKNEINILHSSNFKEKPLILDLVPKIKPPLKLPPKISLKHKVIPSPKKIQQDIPKTKPTIQQLIEIAKQKRGGFRKRNQQNKRIIIKKQKNKK